MSARISSSANQSPRHVEIFLCGHSHRKTLVSICGTFLCRYFHLDPVIIIFFSFQASFRWFSELGLVASMCHVGKASVRSFESDTTHSSDPGEIRGGISYLLTWCIPRNYTIAGMSGSSISERRGKRRNGKGGMGGWKRGLFLCFTQE